MKVLDYNLTPIGITLSVRKMNADIEITASMEVVKEWVDKQIEGFNDVDFEMFMDYEFDMGHAHSLMIYLLR
jgi:hypothetical protein